MMASPAQNLSVPWSSEVTKHILNYLTGATLLSYFIGNFKSQTPGPTY